MVSQLRNNYRVISHLLINPNPLLWLDSICHRTFGPIPSSDPRHAVSRASKDPLVAPFYEVNWRCPLQFFFLFSTIVEITIFQFLFLPYSQVADSAQFFVFTSTKTITSLQPNTQDVFDRATHQVSLSPLVLSPFSYGGMVADWPEDELSPLTRARKFPPLD